MEKHNQLTDQQREMLAKIELVCESNKLTHNIILIGHAGTGKTHFAQTAAHLAIQKGTVIVHQTFELSEKQHELRAMNLLKETKPLVDYPMLEKKPVKLTKPKNKSNYIHPKIQASLDDNNLDTFSLDENRKLIKDINYNLSLPEKEPKKCNCGSSKYQDKTIDQINNTICEYERYCSDCGNILGHWAYGHWQNSEQ